MDLAVQYNAFTEHGQGSAMDNVILSEKKLVGTIPYRPGENVSSKKFFNLDSSVSSNYQTLKLPYSIAEAYDVKYVTASHNMQLVNANAALAQVNLQTFEQTSRVRFDQDNRTGIFECTLADLLPYTWAQSATAAGVNQLVQIAKAFPSYELTQILQFGAAQDLSITFLPATGWVAAAYAATTTPFLPDLGLAADGGTPANYGFMVQIGFLGIRQARKA